LRLLFSGWVEHLAAGFATEGPGDDIDGERQVPDGILRHATRPCLSVIEGHVRHALRRIAEKPWRQGYVPGMPIGSPGMEGGKPEKYDVVLFGPNTRRIYMSFVGNQST
jgi:hypothetical protein